MKAFIKIFLASIFFTVGSAQATTLNFIQLTESGGYGEGGWSPLSLTAGGTNVWITGHASTDDDSAQYAYLDWGKAGLGTCKDATGTNVMYPNGANKCHPGNDDNVTTGEWLTFKFDQDVMVTNVWFNNNHDGGLGAGDKATIQGNQYAIVEGYAGGANGVGSFLVTAGSNFNVAYFNEEFYISAIEFVSVPEPSAGILLALGLLLSLVYARGRKA